MGRFWMIAAAMGAASMPLFALASLPSAPASPPPAMIGADHPILLKRMVVTAIALPDAAVETRR